MLSERQTRIITLLQKEDTTVHSIAKVLDVSDRTVSRDIKVINDVLKPNAQVNLMDGNLTLSVFSASDLYQILEQNIPIEIQLLFQILLNNGLSLDDYGDMLYLTKSKVREYIDKLNYLFNHQFKIELKQGTGVVFNGSLKDKVDLVANIVLDYRQIVTDAYDDLPHKDKEIDNYRDISRQYIGNDEIKAQFLANKLLHVSSEDRQLFFKKKLTALNRFELQEDTIRNDIVAVFINNGLDIPGERIINMCLGHTEREVLFPLLLIKNKSTIEAYLRKQPIAFDIAKKISSKLIDKYNIIVNTYYISLYVMLVLSSVNTSIYKIVLISKQPSISSINKYLIEEKIKGSQVSIVNNVNAINTLSKNYTIILDASLINTQVHLNEKIDLIISSLISENDILKLRSIVRDNTFSKLLKEVQTRYNFSINNNSSNFFAALEQFLTMLKNNNLISEIEWNAIVSREKAGNQLIINDYSLPHIISSSNKNFRLYLSKLRTPVVVDNQFIDRILIIIIGIKVENKSEIFKYLFDI